MKLCEKLYELRRAAGLSQEELAERLNVSRQARLQVGERRRSARAEQARGAQPSLQRERR